ncbi:MAG: SEC-C metal-binding domain-containing protein [Spirochaetia bacterium]
MKVGRNNPCPCGSGKKYKHCCYAKDSVKHEAPEPAKDTVSEDTPDDDVDGDRSDKEATKTLPSHQKDRSRFQGDARGRSVSFRPKASRGSQRGT